jgi:hypothetical protein
VVGLYAQLPDPLKLVILQNIKSFHQALRECGRSDDEERRFAAMKLIALGRQGKLAYVLSENLHEADEKLAQAACEAMIALARWVATETRALQRGAGTRDLESGTRSVEPDTRNPIYDELIEQRPEIEAAVARAMNVHRGKQGRSSCGRRCCCAIGQGARPCRSCTRPSTRAIADGASPPAAAGERARRGVSPGSIARRVAIPLWRRLLPH